MTTNAKAEANKVDSKNDTGAFILDASELASLASSRGRKATDSVYLSEVTKAMESPTSFNEDGQLETGDVHAIKITEARSAAWIGPQLRKAAKQLNIDSKRFTVLDRSGTVTSAAPKGFVAYWVKPEKTPAGE